MLKDSLALAALLACLASFVWALMYTAAVVTAQMNTLVDPACATPSDCMNVLASSF